MVLPIPMEPLPTALSRVLESSQQGPILRQRVEIALANRWAYLMIVLRGECFLSMVNTVGTNFHHVIITLYSHVRLGLACE